METPNLDSEISRLNFHKREGYLSDYGEEKLQEFIKIKALLKVKE